MKSKYLAEQIEGIFDRVHKIVVGTAELTVNSGGEAVGASQNVSGRKNVPYKCICTLTGNRGYGRELGVTLIAAYEPETDTLVVSATNTGLESGAKISVNYLLIE